MVEKIRTLIPREDIEKRIAEIAAQIEKDYEGKEIHLISVLKGGVMFTVDLARAIKKNTVYLHFMSVSSYGNGTESSGNIKINMDLDESIKDKTVIIAEDIIDSGRTLSILKKMLLERQPESLKICTLLDKPDRRVAEVEVDYTCFKVPDEFVVGCGLDYAQKYRNLDYVGIISFEEE